jgi:DNA polymerase III delta prime subunit
MQEQSTTFITKYKPYYIDDFHIDYKLKSVIKTLHNIDDLNILVLGNSSSGKTSLLYAIIREYYGLTKTQTIPENNILFINNLKEQGINYYRNEMKTFCQSHSSIYGKKKMIVIDDLDMISEQCQQVFRNYIDKYKNNVHFVTAASNMQKVIESIQSRVHIVRMDSPSESQLQEAMNRIISQETLHITTEAREYLLGFSKNSIRKLINHLEKIHILSDEYSEHAPISLHMCKKICSNISFQQFEEYTNALKMGSLISAIRIFYDIHDYGYSVIDILDYFFSFIKTTDLLTEDEKYRLIPVLCKYITIFHSVHEDVIELALISKEFLSVIRSN